MNLLIFDCDGVLVESESLLVSTVLTFLHQRGMPMDRGDYMRRFMGLSAGLWEREMRREWADYFGHEPAADCFDALFQLTGEKMASDLVAVAGARQAIEALPVDRPVKRCVASSSSVKGLRWKLAHTQLLDLFDPYLYSSSLVSRGKPNPDLFLYAAAQHQQPPAACIVIEDSANGVLAAKRAGMRVVGFTAAGHCLEDHPQTLLAAGADCIVTDFQDLAGALRGLAD
jgi:HAD superfamily hydrolase (TIGR01509 family)